MSILTPNKRYDKKPGRTLEELADAAFIRALERDRDLRTRVAFKQAGHSDLLEAAEKANQPDEKLHRKVNDVVIEMIDKDPTLVEPYLDAYIRKMMLDEGDAQCPAVPKRPPVRREDTVKYLAAQIDAYERLRSRLGSPRKRNWADLLKDPRVRSAAQSLIGEVMNRLGPQRASPADGTQTTGGGTPKPQFPGSQL
jgi:hypothetical protein